MEADELESSLRCLAAHGAEVRALDPRNRIALSWARAKHREEIVKLLREGRGFRLFPGMLRSRGNASDRIARLRFAG